MVYACSLSLFPARFLHVMRIYVLTSFHIASPFRRQIFLLSTTCNGFVECKFHYSHYFFFVPAFYFENAIECNVFVHKCVSLSICIFLSVFSLSLSLLNFLVYFLFTVFMTDTYKVIRSFFFRRSPNLLPLCIFFIVNCICKSFPSISI